MHHPPQRVLSQSSFWYSLFVYWNEITRNFPLSGAMLHFFLSYHDEQHKTHRYTMLEHSNSYMILSAQNRSFLSSIQEFLLTSSNCPYLAPELSLLRTKQPIINSVFLILLQIITSRLLNEIVIFGHSSTYPSHYQF